MRQAWLKHFLHVGLNLFSDPEARHYHSPYFTDQETEAQWKSASLTDAQPASAPMALCCKTVSPTPNAPRPAAGERVQTTHVANSGK